MENRRRNPKQRRRRKLIARRHARLSQMTATTTQRTSVLQTMTPCSHHRTLEDLPPVHAAILICTPLLLAHQQRAEIKAVGTGLLDRTLAHLHYTGLHDLFVLLHLLGNHENKMTIKDKTSVKFLVQYVLTEICPHGKIQTAGQVSTFYFFRQYIPKHPVYSSDSIRLFNTSNPLRTWNDSRPKTA